MIFIDKIAYTSKILRVNPGEKIFFSILTLLTCIIFNNIYNSIFVLLTMFYAIVIVSGIDYKVYLKFMSIPLTFIAIGSFTIIFTKLNSEESILKIFIFSNYYGITIKGLIFAISLTLKSLACVSCLYFLIFTTPVVDILYFLEKIKLPKVLNEIIGLVYRYIFLLLEVAGTIYVSQDSRLGYIDKKKSFFSAGKLVSALFLTSIKKADEIFLAMESRCYTGEINFLRIEYIKSAKNIVVTVIINILVILIYFIGKYY